MKKFSGILTITILSLFVVSGDSKGDQPGEAPRRAESLDTLDWNYLPPDDMPVNALLLTGAKRLLNSIYEHSPLTPDYLPHYYKNMDTSATSYVVHAARPTTTHWDSDPDNSLIAIEWSSKPGGPKTDPTNFPKGWSATVTTAGPVSDYVVPTQCHTDCSGFITSLFVYANTELTTQFTSWNVGSSVPEAGCFDPDGDCLNPNPNNYYRFFTTTGHGFQNVSFDEIAPGDMIAWARGASSKKPSDTGHIMLVAAVADINHETKYISVIDESTGVTHTDDTRGTFRKASRNESGLGMGIIKLTNKDDILRFYWKTKFRKKRFQPGNIAIGRAL